MTEARIREEVRPSGLDWISALRGPAVRSLVESGAVQLSLFDQTDLVEIRSDAYPGERLMVCRNPLLAEERRASGKICSGPPRRCSIPSSRPRDGRSGA